MLARMASVVVHRRYPVVLLVALVFVCNASHAYYWFHHHALLYDEEAPRLTLSAHIRRMAVPDVRAATAARAPGIHSINEAVTSAPQHTAPNEAVESVKRSTANTPDTFSSAMPWHPMSSVPKQEGRQPWMVPIFVTSAFWVPNVNDGVSEVRLVVAFDKAYIRSAGIKCVFKSSGSNAVVTTAYSLPGVSLPDGMFVYSAGYATCSSKGLQRPKHGQLQVTLTDGRSVVNDTAVSWVPVEVIPDLTQEQLDAYSQGTGPIAACTAPVHEDSFAASMVEWAEFHKLVGVEKVFLYDFNSGPLLKPQLDHYARHGLFEVFEWIIPTQITSNPNQECLLPFFHPSVRRGLFESGRCSMHQDVYQIAWWGQPLALFDCVLRARARYRWVVVLDFDEYIVPKSATTLTQLFQQISHSTGRCNAQYTFTGRVVCSGCRHQYHVTPGVQNSTVPNLHVIEAPHANVSAACLQPSVGFQHMLWASVTADASDHYKSVVDPMAVKLPGIHSSEVGSFGGCQGTVELSTAQGLKLHDRAHDIHKKNTFMEQMLPLLWEFVHQRHDMPLSPPEHLVPLSSHGCAAHKACGGGAPKSVNFTMCNAFGAPLSTNIEHAVGRMFKDHVFDSWLQQNASVANVYGGHTFDKWGPPKQ